MSVTPHDVALMVDAFLENNAGLSKALEGLDTHIVAKAINNAIQGAGKMDALLAKHEVTGQEVFSPSPGGSHRGGPGGRIV